MNLLDKPIYRIQDIEIVVSQGCLKCSGVEQHIRQQTLRVLLYLIEHRDRLVPKDELIEAIWEGTAVTDNALVQCIADIRRVLGDDSRNPRFIKTFPRVGYRFVGLVEELHPREYLLVETEEVTSVEVEYREEQSQSSRAEVAEARSPRRNRLRLLAASARARSVWAVGMILALAITGSLSFYLAQKLWSPPSPIAQSGLPAAPGKISVAVMHFQNLSGNFQLNWLQEGLADMLITDLSRSDRLSVLSRQQLHILLQRSEQRAADESRLTRALEVARRVKAELVVSGSFVNVGERIRIDARIHKAQDGARVAAESLVVDRLEEILERVDLLSFKLARHLGARSPATIPDKGLATVMTNNLEAYRNYSLAVELAQAYHSLEAIELLEKAIAHDPEFAMAHARIGYTYATIHNNEGDFAKPHLEKAFQLSHRLTEKDRLWIITWYSLAHEEIDRAIRTLRQLIAQYPLEVEAYWRLGWLLENESNFEEVVSVYKQGLAIDPEARVIWNSLGLGYSYQGRYEDAIAALKRYVEVAPDESNAYDSLGMCYNESGRFDEALVEFRRAIELNPRFHLTYIHIGDSYAHQGRYRKALEQYRYVLEIAPTNWDSAFAYNKLATLYLKMGNLKQAEAAARQELRLNNDLGGSFLVALARGDRKTAARLKESFLANSPEFRPLSGSAKYRNYFLGSYALKTGRGEEAIDYFRQLAQSPRQVWNDRWVDCLASAYLELGRWDEAIAEYERLIALNPNFALLHYNLADALEQRGDHSRANAEYEKFLELWPQADPDLPAVIAAKRRLASLSDLLTSATR